MQLSDLRSQVRRHIAEPSTDIFSDALLNTKLERSQRDLAGRFALLQVPYSGLVSGPFLALPADFIHFGEDPPKLNGIPLRRTDLNDLLIRDQGALTVGSQGGLPTAYVYEESLALNGNPNTMGLWPSGSGNISFTYCAAPLTMTADTSVPWNGKYEPFHELIAMDTANRLQAEQGASAAANSVFYAIFMKRMEEFKDYVGRGKIGKRIQLRSRIGKGGWN